MFLNGGYRTHLLCLPGGGPRGNFLCFPGGGPRGNSTVFSYRISGRFIGNEGLNSNHRDRQGGQV